MLGLFTGMSLVFAWQMLFLSSPMSLMACLLLLSVSLSVVIGILFSVWYGIILFMVYVGGLLVLFMYSAMISSNMKNLWGYRSHTISSILGLILVLMLSISVASRTSNFLCMTKNLLSSSLKSGSLDLVTTFIPIIGVFLFIVMILVTSILLGLGKIK